MVSMTRETATPVVMEISTQPVPIMYMSMIFFEISSSNVMQFLRPAFPDAQERVLHLGHLRGVLVERENHVWPHTLHELVWETPDQ